MTSNCCCRSRNSYTAHPLRVKGTIHPYHKIVYHTPSKKKTPCQNCIPRPDRRSLSVWQGVLLFRQLRFFSLTRSKVLSASMAASVNELLYHQFTMAVTMVTPAVTSWFTVSLSMGITLCPPALSSWLTRARARQTVRTMVAVDTFLSILKSSVIRRGWAGPWLGCKAPYRCRSRPSCGKSYIGIPGFADRPA